MGDQNSRPLTDWKMMDNSSDVLSQDQLNKLSLARGVSSAIAFVGSCLTLILMVSCKAYKTTFQRLLLYLSMALTAQLATETLQITSSKKTYCAVVGYLNEYTQCVVMLLMLGVAIHLFMQVFNSSPSRHQSLNPPVQPGKNSSDKQYVAFSIFFPFLYSCIGLGTNAYGGPPWCWMITVEKSEPDASSLLLILVLVGVVPVLFVFTITILLLFSIIALYCWWARHFKDLQIKLRQEACVMLVLMIFNGPYFLTTCLFGVEIVCFFVSGEELSFGVLMFYAIFLPISQMTIPISAVIHEFFRRYTKSSISAPHSRDFKNYGTIKNETARPTVCICDMDIQNDMEETFHTSIPINAPSTTCYALRYEFSDEFATLITESAVDNEANQTMSICEEKT